MTDKSVEEPSSSGKRATKRDRVVNELRAMIASGDIPRGTRIHQDELAERFKTSITPVREALRQLEAEGLLSGEPHRGVRVSETNPQEQLGVYVARRLLEPFATQLATQHVSRRDQGLGEELVEKMTQAGKSGDAAGVRDANRDFHFLLYDRCGIPSLVKIIEGPWASFPWDTLEVLDIRAARSVKEHAEILKHVVAGDVAAAGASMERHLARSYGELIKHLTGQPLSEDPFDLIP